MDAIVRWSTQRICLEALEIGYSNVVQVAPGPSVAEGRAVVARFTDVPQATLADRLPPGAPEPLACELAWQ